MRTTDMKGIYSALLVSFDKEGNINEKGKNINSSCSDL